MNRRAREINAILKRAQQQTLEGQRIASAAMRNGPSATTIRADVSRLGEQVRESEAQRRTMMSGLNDAYSDANHIGTQITAKGGPKIQSRWGTLRVAPMPLARPTPAPAAPAAPAPRGWGNWARSLFTRRARVAPATPLNVMNQMPVLTDKLSNIREKANAVRKNRTLNAKAKETKLQSLDNEFAAVNKQLNDLLALQSGVLNTQAANDAKKEENLMKQFAGISTQINAKTKQMSNAFGTINPEISDAEVAEYMKQMATQRRGGKRKNVTRRKRY